MRRLHLPIVFLVTAIGFSSAAGVAPEAVAPAAKPPSPATPLPPGVRVRDRVVEEAATERLRAALLENFREEALGFRVEVEEDLATITGEVRSVSTPAAVSRVARTVAGIKRVDNRLVAPLEAKVSADAEVTKETEETTIAVHDAILVARVRAALLDRLKGAAFDLIVKAKDGVVVLSGKIGSPVARDSALAAAKKVRGVRKATAEGLQLPLPPPPPPATPASAAKPATGAAPAR